MSAHNNSICMQVFCSSKNGFSKITFFYQDLNGFVIKVLGYF